MPRFFVSTPLGFEEEALQEIKEVWPYLLGKDARTHNEPLPEVDVLEGGLEFEAELFSALQLNFFLKTANRVLLRLTSFKTRDLPKFYQKFKSLPWREYLPHAHVEWEVAAQKSRINNEKRLQESAEKALKEIFASTSPGAEPCASIYIRMDDDTCTVSLDSTGEHLHKRGWSILKGEAPVRETIACFILRQMIAEAAPAELAQVTLLDPMAGAGTFLTEGRSLRSGQFQRPYAFQKWKKAPKLFLSPSFALNYEMPTQSPFAKYVGFDLNDEMIPVQQENFQEVERQLAAYQRHGFQKASIENKSQDALQGTYEASGPLWLVVNPPYGERLPTALSAGVTGLAKVLCERYKPLKIGLLYPEKDSVRPVPAGYEKSLEVRVNNGGLRCLLTILTHL